MTAPFRIFESRPKEFTVRAWREIKTGTYRAVGQLWYDEFLPKHFKRGAATRYGYEARSSSYLEKKQQAAKSGKVGAKRIDPRAAFGNLIFTGEFERDLMAHSTFRAFPSRFTVTMQAPFYVGIRSRRGKPDYHAEVTSFTEDEDRAMRDVADTESEKLMKQHQQQRTSKQL